MNPMLSAIKAKRMSKQDENTMMNKSPDMNNPSPKGEGMMEFVQSLSDDQRKELMNLLAKGTMEIEAESESKSDEIEKGGPTPKERQLIDARSAEENAMDEEGSGEIAASMLDRDSLRKAEQNVKPRGLGDRAKMAMAMKLKGKGVIK